MSDNQTHDPAKKLARALEGQITDFIAQIELGTACGKLYRCSTMAVLDAGDSDITEPRNMAKVLQEANYQLDFRYPTAQMLSASHVTRCLLSRTDPRPSTMCRHD